MKERFKKFFFGTNKAEFEAKIKDEAAEETVKEVPEDERAEVVKELSDYTLAEVLQIKQSTGNSDVLKDVLSEEFEIFSEGRNDGLAERYEAFARLKASMLPKTSARGETGQERRLHSGFAEGGFKDTSCGLTKRQMDMARSAGMSFREYEELLNLAPAVKRNRF